jgi:hypothetical protein
MIVARGGFTTGRSRVSPFAAERSLKPSAGRATLRTCVRLNIFVGHKNADGPTPPKRLTEEERWTSSRT